MSRAKIKAGQAYVELVVLDKMRAGLSKAKQHLNKFAKSATLVGGAMAGMAGTAGFGMLKLTERYAEFDDAMRAVKARANANQVQFKALTKQARELGRTTSFTAVEVANLQSTLAQAGKTSNQIQQLTPVMLELARATGTTTVEAAKYVNEAMAGFGMVGNEAEHVADIIAYTANNSFNSAEDIGFALSYASQTAKEFGMSIEETAAILAKLGDAGIKGTRGGRELRKIMTDLATKRDDLAEALNVDTRDSQDEVKGLIELMGDFGEKTKGMKNDTKIAQFNEIFGKIGLSSAMILARGETMTQGLTKMMNQLRLSAGYNKRISDEMDKGIGGSMRRLWSALEGVTLSVGDGLVPVFDALARIVSRLSNAFSVFAENNKWLFPILASFVAVLGALGSGMMVAGIAAFGLSGVMTMLSIAVAAFSAAMSAVVFVLTASVTPLGLVALGVGAALSSVLLFTDAVENMSDAVENYFNPMLTTAQDTMHGIYLAIQNGNWSDAMDIAMKGLHLAMVQGINGFIGEGWQPFLQGLILGFQVAVNKIRTIWQKIITGLGHMIIWLGDTVGLISDKVAKDMHIAMADMHDVAKQNITISTNEFFAPIMNAAGKTAETLEKELGASVQDQAIEQSGKYLMDRGAEYWGKFQQWLEGRQAQGDGGGGAASALADSLTGSGQIGSFSASEAANRLSAKTDITALQVAKENLEVQKEIKKDGWELLRLLKRSPSSGTTLK